MMNGGITAGPAGADRRGYGNRSGLTPTGGGCLLFFYGVSHSDQWYKNVRGNYWPTGVLICDVIFVVFHYGRASAASERSLFNITENLSLSGPARPETIPK